MIEDKFKKVCEKIAKELSEIVFNKIYCVLKERPSIRPSLNPAFPFPRLLRIGMLKDCLAVEYLGPEIDKEQTFPIQGIWHPNKNIFDFLELDTSHLNPITLPWSENIENISFFLGCSIEYLCDYFYDFTQKPENVVLNGMFDFSSLDKPIFISNTTFFWPDINGDLKIRHIDFLEIFPIKEDGWLYHDRKSLEHYRNFILQYKVPVYNSRAHKALNDFIEIINLPATDETKITKFLEDNPEILQLAFGTHKLNPQVILEWQYATDEKNLIPDFLPIRMDGYADILEFKLPRLKSKPIVGSERRLQPSFEIDSAVAQLNKYREWCSQEVNRRWLEREKKIKILHPQKILIIGHSKDFAPEGRQRLRKDRNTTVFTYDEFIEMARFQIYRVR